jgi:hypothetical protein
MEYCHHLCSAKMMALEQHRSAPGPSFKGEDKNEKVLAPTHNPQVGCSMVLL